MLLVGASALPAAAQEAAKPPADTGNHVEEIVVTAQKRPENVQDIAMAVTALSGKRLEQENIVSATELSRFAPSFSLFTANDNRNSTIVIRKSGDLWQQSRYRTRCRTLS